MVSSSSIPVILNPKARSERAGSLPERIRRLSPRVEICPTEHAGHAKMLAYDLVKAGHRVVVAAGGDGTINEAASGLATANIELGRNPDEDAALGVLPTGTMNVFALELGIGRFDIGKCWRAIEMGVTREVDLWRANEHLFVQMAGVGFDAEVIKATTWESKKKFGPLSYLMAAASVMKRDAMAMVVEIPGREPMGGTAALIGSGKRYGGPIKGFRDAMNDDGLLDVLVMQGRGLMDMIRLMRGVVVGGFEELDGVDYFQAAEFSVTASEPVPFQVDGELVGETPVRFSPAERKLRVLAAD